MPMFTFIEFSIPMSGEADSSLKAVRRYLCSCNINKAHSNRLQHLESELPFIHHPQQTKKTPLLSYLKKKVAFHIFSKDLIIPQQLIYKYQFN
jgi:hypothetical protein